MIGKVLAGRYELAEKIAEGGMARVYRGRDTLLKRTVAVKVLKDQMTGDASFIRRFEREAQSAAALSHPNIVNVYDVGEEEGTHFIIMEYVEGRSLKNYIREKGRLSPDEAVHIARQIGEALQNAHEYGVVHRDIKPQNILFSRDGNVKVTDFGIAIAGDGVTVTAGDEIIGSVQYISPEQARGETAGKQSDLYSLGVVLYEMVTGKLPFSGESPVAVAMKHIHEEIIPPRRLVKNIPEALEQIILRALNKDTGERYTSAAEFLNDLYTAEEKGVVRSTLRRGNYHSYDNEDDGKVLRPDEPDQDQSGKDIFGPPVKKRSWAWLKPLIAVLVLALLLAGGGFLLSSYVFVPEVAVPEVREMSQNEATRTLREADLTPNPEVIYVHDEEIEVGSVIRTDPPAGRSVRKNRDIVLYVSKGPDYIVTPDLAGRTEMEARVMLRDLGLTMSVVREHHDEVPGGEIFRQIPGESLRISDGDEVVVYISEGPEPIEMADLVGYSEEGALKYIDEHELRPIVRYQFSPGNRGYVIEQYPEPGEEIMSNQRVELVVGE